MQISLNYGLCLKRKRKRKYGESILKIDQMKKTKMTDQYEQASQKYIC